MALFKCSSCGHILADTAVRCPGCGTPGPIARHPNNWRTAEPEAAVAEMLAAKSPRDPTTPAGSAVERDAKIRLKREHDKVMVKLGLAGGMSAVVLCGIFP